MVMVFVAGSLMALVGASMLAIDVGMLMTARTQAQNAADAGALAGAVALAFDDYGDRSSSSPAVQNAVGAARANSVMGTPVSIDEGDVQFLNDPAGLPNWVRVTVFRAGSRANPVSTLIASFFGVSSADIVANATAETTPANAAECVLPFAVADRWIERQTPSWDPGDTFTAFPKNPSVLPDIFRTVDRSDYTGFNAANDKGLQVVIRAATTGQISPSYYYPLALADSSGAGDYEWNIANCNTSVLHFFDLLTAEAAGMEGPTAQGIQELIAQDPSAYWDAGAGKVVSSMQPTPRVKLLPVFDPYYFDTGKKAGRLTDLKASNFVGIFIEGLQGSDVVARVVPARGKLDAAASSAPVGSFPRVIRLVQ
jgi:hypothetical protein